MRYPAQEIYASLSEILASKPTVPLGPPLPPPPHKTPAGSEVENLLQGLAQASPDGGRGAGPGRKRCARVARCGRAERRRERRPRSSSEALRARPAVEGLFWWQEKSCRQVTLAADTCAWLFPFFLSAALQANRRSRNPCQRLAQSPHSPQQAGVAESLLLKIRYKLSLHCLAPYKYKLPWLEAPQGNWRVGLAPLGTLPGFGS